VLEARPHEDDDQQHDDDAEDDQPRLVGFQTTRYGVVDDPIRISRCRGRGVHGGTLVPSGPTNLACWDNDLVSLSVAIAQRGVGAIDDPVWSETPPTPQAVSPKTTRYRWLALVAIVLAVVALGAGALIVLRSGHPGGDPGGAIAAEARIAVSRAVPSGSQVVGRQTVESKYEGCFYGSPGSGWTPVTSGEAFKTRLGDSQVISDVGANLRASGWTEVAENASGATWTKTFNDGSAAKLRLLKGFVVLDGWTAWIDAQAKGATCGGPSTL
jgi:hypothetical protein